MTIIDILANSSLEDEEDYPEHKGVYHLPPQPKVLFSEEIEIKTEELPRWQPKIIIDRRMLEDE